MTSNVRDNLKIYKNRFAHATPNADFITYLSEGVFLYFLAAILFQFAYYLLVFANEAKYHTCQNVFVCDINFSIPQGFAYANINPYIKDNI